MSPSRWFPYWVCPRIPDRLFKENKTLVSVCLSSTGREIMQKGQANMNESTSCGSSNGGLVRTRSEFPPAYSFSSEPSKRAADDQRINWECCTAHGSVSVVGRRRVMEDAITVAPGRLPLYDFFGVYDGHGGDHVAQACQDRLHKLLAEEVAEQERRDEAARGGAINWQNVMAACFAKMDGEIHVEPPRMRGMLSSSMLKSMGSTAVVLLVGADNLVVANCGDSRAVLFRDGVPVQLSSDHKPERPDERARVELAGGSVINWYGHRVLGILSISRSIGDHFLRPYVISEPEVTVWERKESDEFVVIGSDGLWDVVTNDLACKLVQMCLSGRMRRRRRRTRFMEAKSHTNFAMEAASILAELAIARGSKDNISVIVVQLNKPTTRSTP